jgi:hypothetical protein
MRSSVVLPAPFGPNNPVMPGITSNVTSLTATTLPNQRDTPCTRITGFVLSVMAQVSDSAPTTRWPERPSTARTN